MWFSSFSVGLLLVPADVDRARCCRFCFFWCCRPYHSPGTCILGVNQSDDDLLEFIEQLEETDGLSIVPPSVLRIRNYKVCRGAIMFGDTQLPSECSLIAKELKRRSLCLQCAHGRPTMAPLVNL